MADYVPTSGPWQTDTELQRLREAVVQAEEAMRARGLTGRTHSPEYQTASLAYRRYVEANRQRLGIPDNYWPDPTTDSQTLYDPNQNQLRDAAITGGAMAGGAYGLGALGPAAPVAGPEAVAAGAGSAGAGATGTAGTLGTTGHLTNLAYKAVPAAITSQGASQLVNRGGNALDMLRNTVPGAASEAGEGLNPILRAALGALAGIGPALMAGRGNEPSAEENALMDQARQLQALQQKRIEYQDPMFRAVTQLANSRLPTAYQAKLGDR